MSATDTSTTRAGRLDVCINNAWGTVCDDRFNSLDATVACTQLEGFNSSGKQANSFGIVIVTVIVHSCMEF